MFLVKLKLIFIILNLLLFSLLLSGCQTLSKTLISQLQSSAYNSAYPAAEPRNPQFLLGSPKIDLSAYKPVQTRPHHRADMAIAVAASGGGYRAANLTAGVLMGLEQIIDPRRNENLLQEVDYFSTVSGGGFAVGYYIASLKDFLQTHHQSGPFSPQFSFTNTINQLPAHNPLDTDYTGNLFFADNRNQQLERAFAESLLRTKTGTLTLGDMFILKTHSNQAVELPYWVSNSTIYQNAQIFPFTPRVLAQYGVETYPYNNHIYTVKNYADMPAAVGMTASASFPFALTPTVLGSNACRNPKKCYLQLLDGGLSDNSGVYTALDLLKQDPAKTKILIIIDAYAGQNSPFSQQITPPSGTALFWGVLGMSSNASRQIIKRNIQTFAKSQLCFNHARNVLVIYLDLANYARAQQIQTSLFMTPPQQKLLFNTGQHLVKNNPVFNQQLKALLNGNKSIGLC